MLLTALLALPAALANDTEPWVPVELFRDTYLFLDARVGELETTAILDSGAAMTCISKATAERLGLEGGLEVTAQGIGGPRPARLHGGVDIAVGSARLENLSVVEIDFAEVERQLGRELPLVLGVEVFRRYVVDVDYPNARVAFREPEGYEYRGDGRSVPLHDTMTGLWAVDLAIEGREPVRAALDTGSGGTLSLVDPYVRAAGLLEDREPLSTVETGGVGGSYAVRVGTLETIELGGFELRDVPAMLGAEGAPTPTGEDGAIGGGILNRFRVVFDVPRARLILERDAAASARPFRRDRFGLDVLLDGDALEVVHVSPGSPAAAAGWKAGMGVVAIDDRAVGPDYYEELFRWPDRPAGARVVLRDGEGREHTLVAANYY